MWVKSKIFTTGLFTLLAGLCPVLYGSQNCEVTVSSSVKMRYDKTTIEVPTSCSDFTVHLKYEGKIKRSVMGHNLVIGEASQVASLLKAAAGLGLKKNYLPVGKPGFVAGTKVIGGGEQTSISFKPGTLDPSKPYKFFCSFPGHSALMKGDIKLIPGKGSH